MSTAADRAASVRVSNLSKTYYPSPGWMRLLVRSNIQREVVALDHINFDVGPGEICAVVGPNGAGKTTTFRILVGLTTLTSGEARVLGYDCDRQSVAVRRVVGWMPAEDRSLIMRLSCAENLHFHGRLQGLKGDDLRRRIRDTLSKVGLADAAESSVFALSAGMKARLQLARALLADPKVLILDEPTGSVDPVASHDLLNLIISIVEEQKLAALISSHRLEEIEALHSHAILLDKGQIRYDGDLDTLRLDLDRPSLELVFVDADAARRAAKEIEAPGLGEVLTSEGPVLQVVLAGGVSVGQVLNSLGGLLGEVEHLTEKQTPLRDLLAQMYRRDKEPVEDPS
ncbi:MAG: ABC transporter ATP-binding protein [Acidimicrobiia bacterium]